MGDVITFPGDWHEEWLNRTKDLDERVTRLELDMANISRSIGDLVLSVSLARIGSETRRGTSALKRGGRDWVRSPTEIRMSELGETGVRFPSTPL